MFADRADAGRRLAAALGRFASQNPCVLALPRGGVPVAVEIAEALHAPLDLVLVRKIGAPFQPELGVGAVVDGERPELVLNEDLVKLLHVPEDYLADERAAQLEEIERRRHAYVAGRPRVELAGKTVIVVDDGIATGATIRAAVHATRRAGPKRIVIAVPVAPFETLADLRGEVDEIVCLETPQDFGAIGSWYDDFRQLTDADVQAELARVAHAVS